MVGGTPFLGWGVPWPGLDGGEYPSQIWMLGGTLGTPPPIRQSSIASTCYVAGGMPLAFTQEDFLVLKLFAFGGNLKLGLKVLYSTYSVI